MNHCKPLHCKCIAQIISCTLLISNSMISRSIWKNHALVGFSKAINSTRPSYSCYFEVFGELTRVCFFQIALEIMLFPKLNVVRPIFTIQIYPTFSCQTFGFPNPFLFCTNRCLKIMKVLIVLSSSLNSNFYKCYLSTVAAS